MAPGNLSISCNIPYRIRRACATVGLSDGAGTNLEKPLEADCPEPVFGSWNLYFNLKIEELKRLIFQPQFFKQLPRSGILQPFPEFHASADGNIKLEFPDGIIALREQHLPLVDQ
nr:hypothetical protein [Gimesia maris]